MYTRHEMLDVVKVDGRARGIIARNLVTGKIERFAAHAVVIGTGGYVIHTSCLLTRWRLMDRLLCRFTAKGLTLLILVWCTDPPDLCACER